MASGKCPDCGLTVTLDGNGKIYAHTKKGSNNHACSGGGKSPK
ncbi:MAG: hypothetical protein WCA46_15395 [Actinocatenispora sp.]